MHVDHELPDAHPAEVHAPDANPWSPFPQALPCARRGFGPSPAATLFPIRGAPFQKFPQLLSGRDDVSGSM